MISLVSIESAGPASKARRLVFSDGSEPRLTSASVVKELGLVQDQSIEPSELETLLAEAESRHARDRALRMLGYRDRSESEVRRALEAEGYPRTVARAIVDRLVEVELIDDARFAAAYARTRAAAGYGPRRISRELQEKGVAEDALAAALAPAGDDPVARARRAVRNVRPTTRQERDRAIRRLLSRGFDMGTALAAIEPDDDEDPPAVE